jgi:hypothetical protein
MVVYELRRRAHGSVQGEFIFVGAWLIKTNPELVSSFLSGDR